MKILAIDSSGMPASVAVCEDGTLLAEYTLNFKRTHSQTLVPMLDEVRNMLELDLESIDAIAAPAPLPGFGSGQLRPRESALLWISRSSMFRHWKGWPIISMVPPVSLFR